MNFKWFKVISKNFTKLFSSPAILQKEEKIDEETLYFSEEFSEYFKAEDCLFCYQMIDEGYKPSAKIISELNRILVNKLESKQYKYSDIDNIKSVEPLTRIIAILKGVPTNYGYKNSLLDEDYEVPNEKTILEVFKNQEYKEIFLNYLNKFILNLENYYAGGLDITGDFYDRTLEQNTHKKEETTNLIYIASLLIKRGVLMPQEIHTVKDIFKEFIVFIEMKTVTNYKKSSFDKIGKESIDSFIKNLSIYQTQMLGKDNRKENLLKKLKSFESRKKTLSEEIKDLIIKEEYSIDNLPQNAKEQVQRITTLIENSTDKEVTSFVQERLPVILKKYFSIDEDYRTTLKSVEGYNAQELMSQSLENIERIIIAKKEDNNYDLISELSIENRKLKYK